MPYKVFISHSYQDRDLAEKVADIVRSKGAQVLEMSFEPGEQFSAKVAERLGQSNEMIIIVTSDSARNPWLHWEIGLAAGLDKKITSVLKDVNPVDIPPPLSSLQAVNAGSLDQLRRGLAERIASEANR
jgi:hypothetical protein